MEATQKRRNAGVAVSARIGKATNGGARERRVRKVRILEPVTELVPRRHYDLSQLPAHRQREAIQLLQRRAELRLRYNGEHRPYEWAAWFAKHVKWRLVYGVDSGVTDVGAWGVIERELLKQFPEMQFVQVQREPENAGGVA